MESSNEIILCEEFNTNLVLELKTKKQLEAIEKFQHVKLKAEHFFHHQLTLILHNNLEANMTECYYFRWRLVFAYWIKNDRQKRWIFTILSKGFIKLLKLEFPEENNQLQETYSVA